MSELHALDTGLFENYNILIYIYIIIATKNMLATGEFNYYFGVNCNPCVNTVCN